MSGKRGVGGYAGFLRGTRAKVLACFLIASILAFASVTVTANVAPHIAIIEPGMDETVKGVITVWAIAWDEDGDEIVDVWVQIDFGALRNATYSHDDDEGSWWFYVWNTSEVDDGWHHVTAIAFDGIDEGSHTIEVYVDNEPDNNPPTIEIIQPEHGDTVSGTITVLMLAWDDDGLDDIDDVWVQIDTGDLQNATHSHDDGEGSWWFYVWNTSEVDDGWHDVKAFVWDGKDEGYDVIEVYVDNNPENHPPHVVITEPDGGATVSGLITIWMCGWDLDGNDQIEQAWVKIDGGAWREAIHNHTDLECSWWYYEWNTTEVEDGWHHITAIVYDGIEYGDDLIEVYVDNEPENNPPGIVITDPENAETVSGTIIIWMCAWDADGNEQIENVWVRIDWGDLRNATHNHTDDECSWWYYEWDTTEVEDGWHVITAIAFDGQDDAHHTIEVYVDNEPENNPPGIAITEPDEGDTVSGTIVIWMCAWDPDGNEQIENVWARIDHGEWRNATHNHTDDECSWWYYEWDSTEVEDGWHYIGAIAYDGKAYADIDIEVYVDNMPENHPPGIEITEPENAETVSGTITIWMCAWNPDGNEQIENVWVKIDYGELRNATHNHTDDECSWWYYEWDTTEVEDGWHVITAIAFDGQDDAHHTIEVYVDNEPENNPPGVEIIEPDNGDTVSGTIVVWICAWDPDGNEEIENVWVKIDYGELRNATHNHTDDECSWWYYEWDTTEVEDGWHVITAIAFDGQDDAHHSIEVYVDNEPENSVPGIIITEPEDGDTVSGVIVIWMCAWDADGEEDIENVWVRIDYGDLRNATYNHSCDECMWWYYEWDTTEVEDGWHHIKATVYDGQDDGHDEIEVYVDNDEGGGTGPINPAIPPGFGFLYLILALIMVALMGAFSALAGTEVGKFALFKFMILPLYTKIRKKDVLDQFVRGEIYGYIKVNPGDNYTTIKKNLDLNNGTLTYHLLVLEREGLIKSWSQNGHKYFYPLGVKVPDNGLKSPNIHESILKSILESPGITVRDIAAVNGISRQLANYHVRKMAAEGKILLERKSFSKVCYPKPPNRDI